MVHDAGAAVGIFRFPPVDLYTARGIIRYTNIAMGVREENAREGQQKALWTWFPLVIRCASRLKVTNILSLVHWKSSFLTNDQGRSGMKT